MLKKIILVVVLPLFLSVNTYADCESILENNVGWTIIDSKTIDGYINEKGKKIDSFEGCDYDRVIIFRDGTTVTCNSYGYQYAYAPTAIILGKSITYKGKNFTLFKMIVEDEEYDIK